MQTKSRKRGLGFRKLYTSFSKYLHFNAQNNIVSRVKHLCLGSQTILFHLPNNIVSSAKVKCLENETQKHQVSFAGRRAVSTNRMVIKGRDISVYKETGERCFILTHGRWKAPGAYRRQSAFCESSEKGLGIHESVFWCEEEHRDGLRLTKCQFREATGPEGRASARRLTEREAE